jgi:hypothetical protein
MVAPRLWNLAVRAALAPLAASLLLGGIARADRVVTKDGRILQPKKARAEGQGYRLEFENGTIVVPDGSLVASAEIEGDMSDYVPANEDEKEKLAQGYVKYRGRWMSRAGYQEELRKQGETSRARTELLAKHSDWSNAWEKETQHFRVRSNTSPEILDFYAELLETFYALMDEKIGIDPTPSLRRSKMQVNVFKSHAEFLEIAQAGNPSVLGFFSPMDKSLNFYHDYAEPSRSEWVALHECTHLLTFLIDPQYMPQIWLNEAVADYFGSSRVYRDKKGKLRIEPGELQMDRTLTVQQAIKNLGTATGEKKSAPGPGPTKSAARPFTRLEELFRLKREEFDGFQYAHAWSFVYFLQTGADGKYRKAFDRFFKGLYTLEKGIPFEVVGVGGVQENGGVGKVVSPEDIRAYLLKHLKVKDVDALEREWREYVEKLPIEGAAARLKRGMLAVNQLRLDEGLADLDAAIEGGTQDPRAFGYRARAHAGLGEVEKALADYRTAIEKDPLDAAFRYEYSRLLVGRTTMRRPPPAGSSGASVESEDAPDAPKLAHPEAKAQAGLAAELSPDNDRFRAWFERFE